METLNNMKYCLVTGANAGLGKAICLGLAKGGHHLIMVSRNPEKGQAALEEIKSITGSDNIDLLIADLSVKNEVEQLSDTIIKRYPRIDVLINNAGLVRTKKTFSTDTIEMTLATNHLAPYILTERLLPLLEQSTQARVINISSAIHKLGKIDFDDLQFNKRPYSLMKAYAQSKLLLTLSTFELARRLKNTDITVNCIHPGAVKTQLGSDNPQGVILKTLDKVVKAFFISPSQAAKPILELALSDTYKHLTGAYFSKNKEAKALPLTHDIAIQNKVKKLTDTLIQNQAQHEAA